MKWGTRLESAIAYGVAEDQGWMIDPLKVYIRDPEARMGSSFDFQVHHPEHGGGIMEIKNVDSLVYKRSWKDDGAGNIEAPEHIELQVQHQMEVAGFNWCAIVALVGGNEAKLAFRRRDPAVGRAIRRRVELFWKQVAMGEAPPADYIRDAEIIMQLHSQVDQGVVHDAFIDVETAALVEEFKQAKEAEAEAGKRADAAKAKIIERVDKAEKIVGTFGTISLGRTKDTPPTLITADMVGKTYGGRAGYRQFRANWKESTNV
jgi:predicted phage-related endonuclease